MLNNTNNLSCAFNQQIVEYLYGEIDLKEKSKFEAHIKKCSSCNDEFASLDFARAALLEWRDSEFSPLETPSFNIPIIKPTAIKTAGKSSWLSDIKKLFVFQPSWALATLTIFFVFAGLTLFALNFFKADDLAEIGKKDVQKAVVTPTVVKADLPIVEKLNEKTSEANDKKASPEFVRELKVTPDKTVVKASSRSNEIPSPTRENKVIKNRDKKMPPRKQPVLTLTETDEIEDKSIRLADLFEEIGTE